jgi:D-arabinan exo alpha-(1,3)/(1,5)-arabinofuranosidase (non-reducing end)
LNPVDRDRVVESPIRLRDLLAQLVCAFGLLANGRAVEPPTIPVGLDAYQQWGRWPYQRIGARAYMRSTYDRTGGNEGADASHFLYQLSDTNNVTLDVAGPGILYFARYNHWHGSPWHYVVDGTDYLVQETSTSRPTEPDQDSVFLPTNIFPAPLAVTWSLTQGADLSWVPIPFEKSFRMAYSRTHYGTGYYIYHQYVGGAPLSRSLRAWDGRTAPNREVLELVGRAGTDISPTHGLTEMSGVIYGLGPTETKGFFVLTNAPATIRKLSFSVPVAEAVAFGKARLRLTWDGRNEPSVDAPVTLFFGAGTLYNRDQREYLVKAFPAYIRYGAAAVELACFFPMPFFKSARLELLGAPDTTVSHIAWSIRCGPFADPPNSVGYLHATYRDHSNPEPGRDLVLLDTRTTEGGGDWSGSFVGTSFIFSDRAVLNTLEGDPRFFFDDSQTPQGQGTGTEEWGGGGDYWGGRNMTLPFAGHPVGARNPQAAHNDLDKIESAYRFLLADLMPFGKSAIIQLEHGGRDESTEHYQTVAYWYGAPFATLIKTDELKVGNAGSETAHNYVSPEAGAPYEITSRYEWGVDSFPPHTDLGRKTTGSSEFTLRLDPKNLGVLLRRKLDYSFPNQSAEVFVASGDKKSEWVPAGVWYLAGANTCVYSNPKRELSATEHIVETSNRRFRDDEFLVPRALTTGRSSIRIRVKFTPVLTPLYPGHPLAELAWSEIRYDAYCFVWPDWRVGATASY